MPISANKPREDLRPDSAPAFLTMDSAAGLPKANPIQSTQISGKRVLSLVLRVSWRLHVPQALKSSAERPSAGICA